MGENKASPTLWAIVIISAALIACIGAIIAAFITSPLLDKLIDDEPITAPTLHTTSGKDVSLDALVINGISYQASNNNSVQCLGGSKSVRQTGVNILRAYDLKIPDGWYIVWDSYQANWTPDDGQYLDEGLLAIYGPWEGTVNILTGEYCAVPVEWASFAWEERKSASPVPQGRLECIINNGILNSDCQ